MIAENDPTWIVVTSQRAWIGFWALALIWGSSFLFIRIGVEQLSTFQLVFIRTGIAAVGLNIVVHLRGKRLPTDRAGVRDVVILGVVNTVIPFALITWGEKSIESGLAAVLQATAALFTMVIAHFAFADERVTRRTLAGLACGLRAWWCWRDAAPLAMAIAADASLQLLGQLAIVAASFCYALGGVYSRKAIQRRLEPIVAAAGAMTVTAAISGADRLCGAVGGRRGARGPGQPDAACAGRHPHTGRAEHLRRLPDLLRDDRNVGRGESLDGDLRDSSGRVDAGSAVPGRTGGCAVAHRRRDDRRQHWHLFGGHGVDDEVEDRDGLR